MDIDSQVKFKRICLFIILGALLLTLVFIANLSIRERMAKEAEFYAKSFFMECVYGPNPVVASRMTPRDPLTLSFLRVEYVKEFPPEGKRGWAVVYIRPRASGTTQRTIDYLNRIIAKDPGIEVPKRLTLPLTEEQILSEPKAVLEIIRQFDKAQWREFYDVFYDPKLEAADGYVPRIERMATDAGIEVPTE
jgi:hypothetical protein